MSTAETTAPKAPRRKSWTDAEVLALGQHHARGAAALRTELPGRTDDEIGAKLIALGLVKLSGEQKFELDAFITNTEQMGPLAIAYVKAGLAKKAAT